MNPSPTSQRHHLDVLAVDDRDDHQPGQVVDHREGEQVRADPVGQPAADQRQRAERERGVGGHRHAPGVHGGLPGVRDQEDDDRHGHAAQPDQQRQREPAPHPQLAHVELAPRLQPDDQEEQRHQPGVHELAQVKVMSQLPTSDRQPGRPERVVGRELTFAQISASTVAPASTGRCPSRCAGISAAAFPCAAPMPSSRRTALPVFSGGLRVLRGRLLSPARPPWRPRRSPGVPSAGLSRRCSPCRPP